MRIPLKYETPVIKVIDIRLESFICQSAGAGFDPGSNLDPGEGDENNLS